MMSLENLNFTGMGMENNKIEADSLTERNRKVMEVTLSVIAFKVNTIARQ